jgi:hypothetical protein
MTTWFGTHWGAPFCDDAKHVPRPVGSLCLRCEEPILMTDDGVSMPFVRSANGDGRPPFDMSTCHRHLDCHLAGYLGEDDPRVQWERARRRERART